MMTGRKRKNCWSNIWVSKKGGDQMLQLERQSLDHSVASLTGEKVEDTGIDKGRGKP